MANATPMRIGQVNSGGAADALFLKIFGGEVLTAFDTLCVTKDKHIVRTIPFGKTAQFPATWKLNAAYHTPGTELVGQTSNAAERTISIDDQLIADVFIPNVDEAKNHFDYRSEYSHQAGQALAIAWDKNVLQVGVNAARAAAVVTGAFGGTALTSTGTLYKTSATDLAAGFFAAVQAFDEKDVPNDSGRFGYIKPAQYYLLAQQTALVNQDWAAGNGNVADARILRLAGVPLIKTNNLPSTNIATGPTAYQGDFTKVAALIMDRRAVGTLKLRDLAMESEWDIRRQGTLILSKYLMGHGILRTECAAVLQTTT